MKAAIEASLQEANAPRPSAPLETPTRTEHVSDSYQQYYARQQQQQEKLLVFNQTPTRPVLPKLPTYDLDPSETDAILTFNQTVEQVEANGGRDLSRYPTVTELYEKANSLRPKLAFSVDDAGRKERE